MAKGSSYLGGHSKTGNSTHFSGWGAKKSGGFRGVGALEKAAKEFEETGELQPPIVLSRKQVISDPKLRKIVKRKKKKNANRT